MRRSSPGIPTGVRLLVVLALCACTAPAHSQQTESASETVVVVHGLGRTSWSMTILASRLEAAGYRVVNFGYPSTSEPIEDLIDRLAHEVAICCADRMADVHFVTHSMGGVLVRGYLADRPRPHRGRVVMLSPPSQGSEIIDAFEASPFLTFFVGPAGADLGTDPGSAPNRLGPVDFELGIITGDRSLNPLYSWLIPGPDDGKVSVERARDEDASDFLVLPATHTFIMNRRDVADEVVHFLRNGTFTERDSGGGVAPSRVPAGPRPES